MNNRYNKTKNLTLCGLFTALLAICSWIAIPTAVPFTLQTFAVFLSILMLDTRWSITSIVCYILLGCVGIPVFSGFQSGAGVIAGPLGGYIIGFIIAAAVSGLVLKAFGNRRIISFIALLAGLILCYAFGTAWFVYIYSQTEPVSVLAALSMCVIPFIIPDILKMILAVIIAEKLRRVLK